MTFTKKSSFLGLKVYKHVDLTNDSIKQSVVDYVGDKVMQRRFTIREVLLGQKEYKLTHCAVDVAERIYQMSEQKLHRAIETGQGWLAKQLRYSRQTVNRSIKYLESIGLIYVSRRELGYTHQYQFRLTDAIMKQIDKIPNFNRKKYCSDRHVSHSDTQSNLDHIFNKVNTNYRDYTDQKGHLLFLKSKKKETTTQYQSEVWSPAHVLYKEKNVKEEKACDKSVAMSYISAIRAKLSQCVSMKA